MARKDDDKFDGLIMTLVQQSNGIENFYNNIFSFMRRKTDFFKYDDMRCNEMVLSALNEHMRTYREDQQRDAALKRKQDEEKKRKEREDADKKKKEQEAASSGATVEEVTEEEAERIMKEEAERKAKESSGDAQQQ